MKQLTQFKQIKHLVRNFLSVAERHAKKASGFALALFGAIGQRRVDVRTPQLLPLPCTLLQIMQNTIRNDQK